MSLTHVAKTAAAAAVISLVLAGCQKADQTNAAGSSSPFVIGVVMAKSGFMGPVDTPELNAIEVYADQLNDAGGIDGHPVKIAFVDTQSKLDQYAPAARQVLADEAKALVVTCDYDTASPAAQVAQAQNVVVIAPCVGDPIFGPEGGLDLGFSMGSGTPGEASIMAEFADSEAWKTAVLLKDTTLKYTQNQCDIVAKRFGQLGGEVLATYNYKQGDNVTETVSKIRAGRTPDVIFNCGYTPGGATVAKELRDGGVNGPIVSGFGMDGDFWTSGIPGLKDYYVVTYAAKNGDDPDPDVNAFRKVYEKRFGQAPSVGAFVTGPTTLQALKAAYEQTKSWDGDSIAAAMESFENEPFMAGPTTFSDTLHISVDRPMRVMEIVDGRLKFDQLLAPQKVVFLK